MQTPTFIFYFFGKNALRFISSRCCSCSSLKRCSICGSHDTAAVPHQALPFVTATDRAPACVRVYAIIPAFLGNLKRTRIGRLKGAVYLRGQNIFKPPFLGNIKRRAATGLPTPTTAAAVQRQQQQYSSTAATIQQYSSTAAAAAVQQQQQQYSSTAVQQQQYSSTAAAATIQQYSSSSTAVQQQQQQYPNKSGATAPARHALVFVTAMVMSCFACVQCSPAGEDVKP